VISIIIPTLNRGDLLANCLANIEDGPEVIVVDEGLPFAEHCNLGAEKSSGEFLVFLNDDTEPHPGWLDKLVWAFQDARVGIVGAKLVYPDGSIQHSGVFLDRPGGVLTAHNRLTDAPSRYVQAVTGACMAVRRSMFEDVGGFDTGYVNGYEDVDLCLTAAREGWRVWYERDAVVTHLESQSGAARWTHVKHNVDRLQRKWA
jgi:GT2 family glycosyltransferase